MKGKKQIKLSNRIKISDTARKILILLDIVIIALGSGNLIKSLVPKTDVVSEIKETYKYTNKIKTDSHINLKENGYIKEEEIADEQTYLADLIKNIDLNLNYDYTGSKQAKIKYNYKIEAIVSATYTANNKTYDILNKVEKIKESETLETDKASFSINEELNIDYAKYHQMIKNFKQDMGINSVASLYVRLTVDTKGDIDSKEVNNQYVYNYNVSLGEKIALVDYKEQDEKSDAIRYEVEEKTEGDINVFNAIISAVVLGIGILMLKTTLKKTEKLNTIRNEFKLELNRIMRSCESKLVEIEDLNQIDLNSATRVKDISQLLKLSDEALVPIYCCIKDEPEQIAYFIVTKYEKSYVFILK